MVVEADADALFVGLIGGDFVAEPAFEENYFAGFGRVFHEDAVFVPMVR